MTTKAPWQKYSKQAAKCVDLFGNVNAWQQGTRVLTEASIPFSLANYIYLLAALIEYCSYACIYRWSRMVWQSISYRFRLKKTAAAIQTSNTTSSSNSSVIAVRHPYTARFAFWSCRLQKTAVKLIVRRQLNLSYNYNSQKASLLDRHFAVTEICSRGLGRL